MNKVFMIQIYFPSDDSYLYVNKNRNKNPYYRWKFNRNYSQLVHKVTGDYALVYIKEESEINFKDVNVEQD